MFRCGGKLRRCTGKYAFSSWSTIRIKITVILRVALPFSGIKYLSNDPIKVVRNIGIYSKDIARTKLLIQELEKLFVDGKTKFSYHG